MVHCRAARRLRIRRPRYALGLPAVRAALLRRAPASVLDLLGLGWVEPPPPLPVRGSLQRQPSRLQLPHDRLEAHALVFLSLSRGYRDDNALPFISTDVLLEFADWLPWAGRA